MKLAYVDSCVEHHNCECFVTCDPHFRNLSVVTPILIDLSKRLVQ
jgi:hypothetical protein